MVDLTPQRAKGWPVAVRATVSLTLVGNPVPHLAFSQMRQKCGFIPSFPDRSSSDREGEVIEDDL